MLAGVQLWREHRVEAAPRLSSSAGDNTRKVHEIVHRGGRVEACERAIPQTPVNVLQGGRDQCTKSSSLELGQRGVNGHCNGIEVRNGQEIRVGMLHGLDQVYGNPHEPHAHGLELVEELLVPHRTAALLNLRCVGYKLLDEGSEGAIAL